MTSRSFAERVLEKLQDNNPFYIISAACMLGGILAITNSLSWWSIPTGNLLCLIGTLNVYEAVVIGLAIYLIKERKIARDGVMLLILEAFFLVDVTFLNAEIATSQPMLGIFVNGMLFLAAVAKLAVVGRVLGLPTGSGQFGAFVVQLAALFALPIWFRWIDHGELSALLFYGAWWGVGLLIPVSIALCKWWPAASEGIWSRRTMALYAALPLVYCFAWPLAIYFIAAGSLVLAGLIWGPSEEQVEGQARQASDWLSQLVQEFVPRTATAWGMSAIAAAFVFLGLGAALSLRQRRVEEVELAEEEGEGTGG
jgi:hypothetical protein